MKPSMKNSPPPGTGCRTGQRLQLEREFVGVVGQGRELALAQHHAAAVGVGRRADAAEVVLHGDHLRFPVDRQLGVENLGLRDREVLLLRGRESFGGDADLILAGGQRRKRILAGVVGLGAMLARRAAELDRPRRRRLRPRGR